VREFGINTELTKDEENIENQNIVSPPISLSAFKDVENLLASATSPLILTAKQTPKD